MKYTLLKLDGHTGEIDGQKYAVQAREADGDTIISITVDGDNCLEERFGSALEAIDCIHKRGYIEGYPEVFEEIEQLILDVDVHEVIAEDGTVWEIRLPGSIPCECRKKGTEEWEECNWGVFCEKTGVAPDALA